LASLSRIRRRLWLVSLLERCDAVLRVPGESTGADQDVRIARERGLPVYHRIEDLPAIPALIEAW
jgi:hypothetical protein